MTEEVEREHHLERLLFRILDAQSKAEVDQYDVMLMLSLLNLLGMVDVMNRRAGGTAVQPISGTGNPMEALLGMLGKGAPGGTPPSGAAGSGPPFNPAMLMNLMNMMNMFKPPGGQAPDAAGAMNLLNGMMGGQGPFKAPPAGGGTRPETSASAPRAHSVSPARPAPGGRAPEAPVEKDSPPAQAGQVLRWGNNLEKGKRG